ncbi:S9 family peptidase [Stenotrophomonas sp.]|uniref:alpha/beta hydrolase family protein n=1 Tax=Stenotrophomonas sp. TaxID=69392 RepID=UPI0028ACDEC5|nr:S9 family peptidase [Stenotrophomonas sp.]
MRFCLALLLFVSGGLRAADALDLTPFVQQDVYEWVKISPDGKHFAVTKPLEDRTALLILRREDHAFTAKIMGGPDSVVDDFWWANDERVVVSLSRKRGSRDEPVSIGELYAVNVDGKYSMLLASPYGVREHAGLVTEISNTLEQSVYMLDPLAADPRNVLVSAVPVANDPFVRIEKLDIYNRNRVRIAEVPVRRASFVSDQSGEVRFAVGANTDNISKLYYREARGEQWRLINDAGTSGQRRFPLGFSADGRLAYLQVEQPAGPDSIVSWDPATGKETELLRDTVVDPYQILYDMDGKTPIGASFMHERISNRFFDEAARTPRLYRSLEKVFVHDAVRMTSATSDGRYVLLFVWGDRNNGDYFLFDTEQRKADRIFSRREWFVPQQVPPSRLVSFRARDGMQLHGYLTEPLTAANGPRPMVLLPHGGPFTVFDQWRFDDDTQLLAAAGYAVLRVNYRGSGNYGRAYTDAGSREWGARMQDDLADATQWAVKEGIADRDRICIYGASYGGYAALMGVARDPGLYRCAAGYVGVYDLELMHRDTSQGSGSGRTWAMDWLGDRRELGASSPVNLADRIKVPVFLAAGGKDERAPIEHSKRMERALKRAGVPVETLYYPNEGHGFYTEPHRREYYARLLGFLSQHLGGATAK